MQQLRREQETILDVVVAVALERSFGYPLIHHRQSSPARQRQGGAGQRHQEQKSECYYLAGRFHHLRKLLAWQRKHPGSIALQLVGTRVMLQPPRPKRDLSKDPSSVLEHHLTPTIALLLGSEPLRLVAAVEAVVGVAFGSWFLYLCFLSFCLSLSLL